MPWSNMPAAAVEGLTHPFRLLGKRERIAVLALWVAALALGTLTEIRGALIHNRHTDVDTYFTAAWSVRIGSDPYFAQDSNGWHYNYPLLLAVLIDPLADAPATMHRYWLLRFAVSVGIWYVLSVLFMIAGVTTLAKSVLRVIGRKYPPDDPAVSSAGAIPHSPTNGDGQSPVLPYESAADDSLPPVNSAQRWAWRWWVLCFWPLALCVPAIVRSVIRGQVGPLWLMLLCMTAACILDRRRTRAGLWLAGAICLKLVPAFLLLYPIWRRDTKMVTGCLIGLLSGLILIPWAAMGTRDFTTANEHYLTAFLLPGLTGGRIDPAVEHELTDPVTSDTESFKAVLMNMGHMLFGTERSYTPPAFARYGAVLIGGVMTAATLAAAGWRARRDPIDDMLLFGLLALIVLPLSPVCHPHYFMLMIPLIVGVLAAHLGPDGRRRVGPGWVVLLAMVPLSHIVTGLFAWQVLRDAGLDTWVAVAFWAGATRLLYERTRGIEPRPPGEPAGMIPLMPVAMG